MPENARPAITSAVGTIYFVGAADGLEQAYDVTIRNPAAAFEGRIRVTWPGSELVTEPVPIAAGESTVRVHIPDVREPARLTFSLAGRESDDLTIEHRPQRHWTVHLIQFAHHDVGYTDLPSNVFREYCGFYDDVLRFCRETDDFPEESKFRYTVEQGWSLLHYLDHRPPEVCEEMMRRVREGRVEVNALLGNEITELLGPEEMARLLYPVFELKRRYGIPVVCAEHNDIPGISWGVAAALAASGIKWFAPALPDYFRWGETKYRTFWDEEKIAPNGIPQAFYWQAPGPPLHPSLPGGERGEVLFWYGRQGAGGDVDITLRDLPGHLERADANGYPYDVFRYLVMGGHRDNAPPTVGFAHTCREWNERWAYPRLVQSLNARFFPELERQLRDDTPTYRGELPGTDYPVGACCTAYFASLNRATHDQLLTGERFAAAASALTEYDYPAEELREAYYCTLMGDEHTWGLAHPIGPGHEACVAQLSEYSHRAAALAHDVLVKAVNEIADRVKRDEDGLYVVVFNPLNWARTDLVNVPARSIDPCARSMKRVPAHSDPTDTRPLPLASYPVCRRHLISIPMEMIEGGLEVVDASTAEVVAHEVYEITEPSAPVPYAAQRYSLGQFHSAERFDVRFVARDVPPCGWKVYRIAPAGARPVAGPSRAAECALESDFYRVELDAETGAVRSILDKELGRELVDASSEHALNQIVLRSSVTGEVSSSAEATVERGRSGPVSESLIVRTSAPGYPQITQEIVLHSQIKRIDIANRVLKDPTPMLETYFAFPFAFENPRFRHEGSLCEIEPFVDQFPGSNTDYYAIQHWAEVSDSRGAVAISSLDAPVMQFGANWPLYVSQAHHGVAPPGFDHPFHARDEVTRGHIYSLVLLNNYRTNFSPTQTGDLLFRYSITSGDKTSARDFGYSVSLPMAPAAVKGTCDGDLPARASFCEIDAPNVILLAIKRAEDGDGLIVRLLETEGRDTEVTITLPLVTIREGSETNLVEETPRPVPTDPHTARIQISSRRTATVRLLLS